MTGIYLPTSIMDERYAVPLNPNKPPEDVRAKEGKVYVVMVKNPTFSIAAVAYNNEEKERWERGYEGRPYQWYEMDMEAAIRFTPYYMRTVVSSGIMD